MLDPEVVVEDEFEPVPVPEPDVELVDDEVVVDDELVLVLVGSGTDGVVVEDDEVAVHDSLSEVITP